MISVPAHRNPFRPERTDALVPVLTETLPELCARFHALGQRAVLVGRHGSGKSTLLRALAHHLGPVTWLRLRDDDRHNRGALAALPVSIPGILLLDGLEQLGPIGWWQVRRRASRILATSHHPGRLPTLRRHDTSPELLAQVIAELGEPLPADHAALFARHQGDVRACLRELYDRAAGISRGASDAP